MEGMSTEKLSLGCYLEKDGANFAIFSTQAEKMLLNIYRSYTDQEAVFSIELERREYETENIFHIFISGVEKGMAYEWKLWKENKWSESLLDPYAYSVKEYPRGSNKYRNIVVPLELYNNKNKTPIPWEDTVIYEMHIGAFTKHPSSKVQSKGTFEGAREKINYLKQLGVTSLELLPVQKWNKYTLNTVNPKNKEKLKDVWGYNTIAFFALQEEYSSSKEPYGEVRAFKQLVDEVHQAGMEVILDVVYNHTGEGGRGGKCFHFKELAPEVYYKMNGEYYLNCAGTGNTLNTQHPIVKELIKDSLKYWVNYMGVDGFRFDLASILGQDERGEWLEYSLIDEIASDPELSNVKLITESWDAKGCYDVGKMPYSFAEWSDIYRDTVRRFVKGDVDSVQSIVKCLLGEDIPYRDKRKYFRHAIHYITAHDGFTMYDLVSYNTKHNEENGENSQDGSNNNFSDNCGVEGETTDTIINNLRKQRQRNYFFLLLFSKGVPMILMGDEIGRTQKGNNNAYCQDNEILWFNWERQKDYKELMSFVQKAIKIRRGMAWLKSKNKEIISWHGVQYNKPDWSYYSKSIACHIQGDYENYYIIANNYVKELTFELPYGEMCWIKLLDTYDENSEGEILSKKCNVKPYSICLLKKA